MVLTRGKFLDRSPNSSGIPKRDYHLRIREQQFPDNGPPFHLPRPFNRSLFHVGESVTQHDHKPVKSGALGKRALDTEVARLISVFGWEERTQRPPGDSP
jgi:hypothetical protein